MPILIVDDSANSRLVLKDLLKAAGFQDIVLAGSAVEAFQILGVANGVAVDPTEFDLVLLDVLMPDIDGIGACRRIRATEALKDLPIVMVTGQEEGASLEQAFAAGATDYITKPVNKVQLRARVAAALDLKREIDSRKFAYKELEKQLIRSQQLASIGQLVGGVAHDFNNVLTLMMGYSQMGLNKLDPEDSLHEPLTQLVKAAEHAASLTKQLLAMSRVQSTVSGPLDLNALVVDTSKMLSRVLGENVELTTVLLEKPLQICVDQTQIEQILLNLAVNARDVMPGGGKLTIETSISELRGNIGGKNEETPLSEYALLSVSDTGSGMTDEVKSKIFEPFFTTKDAGKGTGLGLATCYSIVQDNGGYLEVESQLGEGSTFRVYLPLAEKVDAISGGEEGVESIAEGHETILLAEDEAALRSMVANILNTQGYTVLQSANGEEGLQLAEKCQNQKIDLLLSDVMMPKMTGTELAQRLQVLRPDIKVILTSGYGEEHLNLSDLGSSIVFVPKPFSPAEITSKVRGVLDSTSTH